LVPVSDQYLNKDNVTICFFGDGAARQGILHETFNMAMTWKLPVIFVCENNGYAMGTSVGRSSNVTKISELGLAYEMPSESVDGMKCETVHEAVAKAAERARKGEGPTFLEINTYRYKGHSMSDPQKYRTKEEVESYKKLDPIETTLDLILKKKYATQAEIDAIHAKADAEIDECVKFAEESPLPDDSELYNHIYVESDYPFLTE
jgi:pyruvate dehydrogenase E1 component alpha subunit